MKEIKIMNIYKTNFELNVNQDLLKIKVVNYGDLISVSVFINHKFIQIINYVNFDGLYDIVDDIIKVYEENTKSEFPTNLCDEFDKFVDDLSEIYNTKTNVEVEKLETYLKSEV